DRENLVFQPGLFKKHRDLVAVRRGSVVKVDHGGVPGVMDFDVMVLARIAKWMRLHECRRNARVKSMGAGLPARESDRITDFGSGAPAATSFRKGCNS